jgi:hypothetical protein
MQQTIGIIGASGDLGSQLLARMTERGVAVMPYSRKDGPERLVELAVACHIIHVCAPVEAIEHLPATSAIVVLHDSVMSTSRRASHAKLNDEAAIVHMLMNEADTVVIAQDTPHHDMAEQHFTNLGYTTKSMTIDDHDYLMARSQAPFALLCATLLPFLYEQADQGLLTPSGQLLADTLRARELAWTDATIHSILQNPQLSELMNDMRLTLARHQPWRQIDSVDENTLKTHLTL